MIDWYLLNDDHTFTKMEEPIDYTLLGWQIDRRRVDATNIGDVWVSTIFLSLDDSFMRGGTPRLFETRVFGGEFDGAIRRYETWDEAVAGHAELVKLVRGTLGKRLWKRLNHALAALASLLARLVPGRAKR